MNLHLKGRDYEIIGLFTLIAFVSGFPLAYLERTALISVHDISFYLPGPALLIGALIIYLARDKVGGTVARNLEVIGSGTGLLAVGWIIWAAYFAAGFPAWGISSAFWVMFLGSLIIMSFVVIGYGFYLFWKLSHGMEGDT
ncbi:MAG: hypothetical protein MUP66_03320 [Candidatus Nanohaloarchaeota archaeon QJJ-5]|nr:hypothetical protein [Candidatus Nanohaloarchaeota archaeon QJJ-5]